MDKTAYRDVFKLAVWLFHTPKIPQNSLPADERFKKSSMTKRRCCFQPATLVGAFITTQQTSPRLIMENRPVGHIFSERVPVLFWARLETRFIHIHNLLNPTT
jgi:hypothetical protein